jgi:iron(III) transport system ATP-binding protein
MAELRCEQVAASYGPRGVLSDVNLVVPSGTLTAILGGSGSGKTTLLRVIMGFVRPSRGSVSIGGRTVSATGDVHLRPEKRGVGYVAQEGALYPHLSVSENVGFGLSRSERKTARRIEDVLELVGLSGAYMPRRVHELSGGEQRRVALARALAPRPPVVLLDEPFSGLDAALRAESRRAVLHALTQAGTTALLVTHDQAEALSTGREVAVLRDGRLAQTAAPDVLYRTPADLDIARFVGDAVILPGHAEDGILTCALGALRLVDDRIAGAVQAMVRPEQIQIVPARSGERTSGGDVRATVLAMSYYGPETTLELSVDGVAEPIVARCFSHDQPTIGDRVEVVVRGGVMAYPLGSTAAAGAAKAAPEPARAVAWPR